MTTTERSQDADNYIRELRDNDRTYFAPTECWFTELQYLPEDVCPTWVINAPA